MNLLHVAPDEKFITFAADVFASCHGVANRFLVFVDDVDAPLRHVRPFDGLRVVDRRAYFRSSRVTEDIDWCDGVVVHYLDTNGARMILRAPARTPVVWSGWGGDYYDLLPDRNRLLLGEATERLLAAADTGDASTVGAARAVIRRLRDTWRQRVSAALWLRRAIRRVDYFSAPIPEDFAVLKRHTNWHVRAEYAQLNYVSVERTFAIGPERLDGEDILVGNSASPANNHADVFAILAGLDLGRRRIVVPLSYGDAAYRDAVIVHGRALFGERLLPLVDYMPLETYNAILARCAIAVMGHRRQQALGNVAAVLRLGAKVFLDAANPILASLRARGAVVASLSDLSTDGARALAPLDAGEREVNARVVEAYWGHAEVIRNACALVDRLASWKCAHA